MTERPVPHSLAPLISGLGDLIDDLPFDSGAVDVTATHRHVAQFSVLQQFAAAWIGTNLTATGGPGVLPRREAVEKIAHVMTTMGSASASLAKALAHLAYGVRTAAVPGVEHSHLRGDDAASRDIALDFYIEARDQLESAASQLARAAKFLRPQPTTAPLARPPQPGVHRR